MPFIGNLGPTEIILVMIVLLLVFGAKRLPELGSGLGKGIREFRRSLSSINSEIDRAADENELKNPPKPTAAVPPTTERAVEERGG
jgi:sec-independent protein translocase protein TatA